MTCPFCKTAQPRNLDFGATCVLCGGQFPRDTGTRLPNDTEALELHGSPPLHDNDHPDDQMPDHTPDRSYEPTSEELAIMMDNLMEDLYADTDDEEPF